MNAMKLIYMRIQSFFERLLGPKWRQPQDVYDGLTSRTAPGVHQAAFELLSRNIKPCGPVLDLAAGSGAWVARMKDAGFSEFTAVELDASNFGISNITPLSIDLNENFAERFDQRFKLVTSLEIVEHLNCPYHFIQNIYQVLEPGGLLLLTTPNLGHWYCRLLFFLTGEYRMFEEYDFITQRHMSPVNFGQMDRYMRDIGFELVECGSAGSFHGPLKKAIFAIISAPFRLLGPRTHGDVAIFLARKKV